MARLNNWIERYVVAAAFLDVVSGLMWLGIVCFWALDEVPPFKLDRYTVFNAAPGGTLFIEAKVERDVSRDCDVSFSLALLDSRKIRHDLGGGQTMTASALADMEHDTPGRLPLAVLIPPGASVGPATLITSLKYVCNP